MDKKKDILFRAYILYLVVCLLAVAIVWKTFSIQVIEGPAWRARAKEISTELQKIEATRGNILAADGSFLAISVPMYEVRMDTKVDGLTNEFFDAHIDSLGLLLSELFSDKSASAYVSDIRAARNEKNRYYLVKKNVTFNDLKEIKTFPIFREGRNKGGLITIQQYKRIKPYGYLASRTIGKVEDESQGLGIEIAFNDFLKGTEGLQLMEKLAGGLWRPVDSDNAVDPVDGYDVHTTIDPILQDVAESELNNQLTIHGADHGCVVLMEVETGNIKAIANLKKGQDGMYYESYNYAIGESMEPGSTIKLATMLAVLEEKAVSINDSIQTGNGEYRLLDDYVLKDSHTGGFGTISIKHSFEVSSNIAMAKIAKRTFSDDPQAFVDYLKKLKLNEPLNIDLPGEGTPRIKDKTASDWSGLSLPMMAIGYESKITPLQVLTLYNAVANDGKMVKPRFASHITSRDKTIQKFETETLVEKICSDETLEDLKTMLEGVVENGTAQNLKNAVYKIAGKTGTAQIANSSGGYRSGARINYLASFVGYFPADNPKYTCIVVVNSPTNTAYYGNVVAGPIFRAVADKVYASSFEINQVNYFNSGPDMVNRVPDCFSGFMSDLVTVLNKLSISHTKENANSIWADAGKTEKSVLLNSLNLNYHTVPDFSGMGARDAIFLAEERNLSVVITGKGKVTRQSIVSGAAIREEETVYLELK